MALIIVGVLMGVVVVALVIIAVLLVILIIFIKSKMPKGEPGFLYCNYKVRYFLFLYVYNFLSSLHGSLNSVILGHEQKVHP